MASVDFFLKIDGIEGESTDEKHKGEIQIESWSIGATNSGTASSATGGSGAGRVNVQDFHFDMQLSKASPKLFKACASGEHLKTATLTCRKAGKDQQEYLKIVLTDVLVASITSAGHGQSDVLPRDQISLNFGKVEYKYKEQKADGSLGGEIIGGWDIKTNKLV